MKKDKGLYKLNLADTITLLRIVGSLALMPIKPFSALFFILYAITGLTDVLDGMIARKTHTESQLGARLDSIADIVFYGVVAFKVAPSLLGVLTPLIWCIIAVVAITRILSYVTALIKYHQFAALHTYMNKLTGFLLFIIPYITAQPYATPACMVISVVAVLAALEELVIHITTKEYCADRKILFKIMTFYIV